MKITVLAAVVIFIFAGHAIAHEQEIVAEPGAQQHKAPAVKLAMGPTSAPQKQGGTGEEPDSSKLHKKPKHKHRT